MLKLVRNNNFRDIYKPPEALEVVFAKCLCWVIDIFIHILFYWIDLDKLLFSSIQHFWIKIRPFLFVALISDI